MTGASSLERVKESPFYKQFIKLIIEANNIRIIMHDETIMIVEDEGLIALQMTEVLEKAGYKVLGPFYSGSQVINALEKSSIVDLILMDITLVGTLDGIETARRIHQRLSIPIIFITAHTSGKMQQKMQEIAHKGVIFKPFNSDELLELIGKTLSQK